MKKIFLGGMASLVVPLCSASVGTAGLYGYTRTYQRASSPDSIRNDLRDYSAILTVPPVHDGSDLASVKPGNPQNELIIAEGTTVRELVVIDQAVPKKHIFYAQIRPGVEVAEITSDSDGLTQLEKLLSLQQESL